MPVSKDGSCRLCHKHRSLAARLLGRQIGTVSLAGANEHGRQATWPDSANTHLFIHNRSWKTTRPVTSDWIGHQLDTAPSTR